MYARIHCGNVYPYEYFSELVTTDMRCQVMGWCTADAASVFPEISWHHGGLR
jgi:hypothetical protein